MNYDQHTQLLTDPKEVNVVAIEREIVQLWKDYGGGDTGSSPITRACSLNFVIVTEDESTLNELGNMAGDVTLEHPARIFLIHANRRTSVPKLDAWISARCSLPVPGGKQVCCEQINLTASGTEANKIPSIVTSLLVSDVPSVVLWKPRVDANDSVLLALAKVSNRILIDTSEDPSPEQSLLAWHTFIRAQDRHVTFGDLAWTHLVPWRSVIANTFQANNALSQLTKIESVKIEYSSTTSPKHSGLSQALLLVAWLAQKLRWIPIQKLQRTGLADYTALFRLDDQAINIRIASSPPRKDFPGGLEGVTIQTSTRSPNGGLHLRCATTEHKDCILYRKQLDGETREEIQNVLSDKSEATLVAQELEVVQRDNGYEAVLNTLGGLLKS
jgi:glucose-6-phosphate dehydrogenase assembly protein OpcA